MPCNTCLLLLPSAEGTIAYSKGVPVMLPAGARWMPLFEFNAWTNLWQEDLQVLPQGFLGRVAHRKVLRIR